MFTIDELQAKLAGGATAVSLAEESLNKIESTKNLNAYISVLNERALQKAAESDKRRAEGKTLGALDGIPVAVKDNMCIEGTRTTAASKILENFVAPYTATAIEKLEAAGAVIVGKTNMDEFAMGSSNETSYFGKVVNPLDETRVPGGSSGGSAVAVASGTVACALGSDTGGSIRQPAACTGVVGLKPTYGRVSRYGLLAYASSLDQIGPFGSTVKDTATLLGAICGIDPHDNTTSTRPTEDFTAKLDAGVKGKVIGVPKEYFGEGLDPECKAAIEGILKKLEAEGATLKEISLPHISYAVSSYYIIATAEASSNLSRYDGVRYGYRSKEARKLFDLYAKSRSEGFGKEVQRRIRAFCRLLRRLLRAGPEGPSPDYRRLQQGIRKLRCDRKPHDAGAPAQVRHERIRPDGRLPQRHLHRKPEPFGPPGRKRAVRHGRWTPRGSPVDRQAVYGSRPAQRRRCNRGLEQVIISADSPNAGSVIQFLFRICSSEQVLFCKEIIILSNKQFVGNSKTHP